MRSLYVVHAPTPDSIRAALEGPADGLLVDLEDSVHPRRKDEFRVGVLAALREHSATSKKFIVRVNDVTTEVGRTDLTQLGMAGATDVLLPKVRVAEELHQADAILRRAETDAVRRIGSTRLWAMVETTECVLNLPEIGRTPRMAGFVFGAGDLSAELGVRAIGLGGQRTVWDHPVELLYHKQVIVLVARANGLCAVDSGYTSVDDVAGTLRSTQMSAQLGFDATMAHSTGQIESIHQAFTPSRDEYDAALRSLEALAEADAREETEVVVDGQYFGGPFPRAARTVVERFERYSGGTA